MSEMITIQGTKGAAQRVEETDTDVAADETETPIRYAVTESGKAMLARLTPRVNADYDDE